MPLPAERGPKERIKALEQAFDALHFAIETVKDVISEPQASGFGTVAGELQDRIKTWREEIENEEWRKDHA